MTTLNLLCEHNHAFEAWFGNAQDFDEQSASGLVVCPWCGSQTIARRPNSPSVARSLSSSSPSPSGETGDPAEDSHAEDMPSMQQSAALLRELHRTVTEHCEDVGTRFPEEVRRVHYGEVDPRGLRGKASPDEVRELEKEGIPVGFLPPLPNTWN